MIMVIPARIPGLQVTERPVGTVRSPRPYRAGARSRAAAASAEGPGGGWRVVLLSGGAGIGTSRLTRDRIASGPSPTGSTAARPTAATARCPPTGQLSGAAGLADASFGARPCRHRAARVHAAHDSTTSTSRP